MKKSVFSLLVISVFFSLQSCRLNGSISGETEVNDKEIILRPACNQFCDEINSIVVVYAELVERESEGSVDFMTTKIKEVVNKKNYKNKIDVESIRNPVPKDWYASINTHVWIELSAQREGMEDDITRYIIRMITPSGAYNDSFLCEKGGGNSSCVDKNLTKFVDDMVGEFLFDRSILNETSAAG